MHIIKNSPERIHGYLFIKHEVQLHLSESRGICNVTSLDSLVPEKPWLVLHHLSTMDRHHMCSNRHWKPSGRSHLHLISVLWAQRLNGAVGCGEGRQKGGTNSSSASTEASGRAELTQHLLNQLSEPERSVEMLYLCKMLLKPRPFCLAEHTCVFRLLVGLTNPPWDKAAHGTRPSIKF